MRIVTLGIANRAAVTARFVAAMGGVEQGARITFESPELLFQTLTLLRWKLLRSVTGTGAVSIREIARLVDRDVGTVRRDVYALIDVGLLERIEDDTVEFPYDAVRVSFRLVGSSGR